MKVCVCFLTVLFCMFTASVFTQDNTTGLLDCPANQIPAEYAGYQKWNKDHVAIRPVIREIFSIDPQEAVRRVRTYLQEPSAMSEQRVKDGHFRLMTLISIEAFTPPGTDLDEARKNLPPREFRDKLASIPLRHKILPCGSTVLNNLSWAEPDDVVGDVKVPQVGIDPGPWVVNWCEEGVKTEDGKCGIRVVETDPMPLKEGPNVGHEETVMIILRCGNPDTSLAPITETVHVPADKPKPIVAGPLTEEVRRVGLTLPLGARLIPVQTQTPPPPSGGWPKWACGNRIGAALCAIGAVAGGVYLNRDKSADVPAATPNNTSTKK
jgi:hypothetical protein